MPKIIVAIDGGSGSGKSTTAKAVAKALGYAYIDTGAMYRAVTLYFIREDVNLRDDDEVDRALDQISIQFRYNAEQNRNETYLNGANVEDEIRGMEVSGLVSPVSEISSVRRKLVEQQRAMGVEKGVVMDGRDIGTVVFPDAELKVFMSCDMAIRAKRREKELLESGKNVQLEEVVKNLNERDRIDSSRSDSPLRKADDAVLIDTSHLTIDEQVQKVLDLVKEKAVENT
jgi:cytidylate kinase